MQQHLRTEPFKGGVYDLREALRDFSTHGVYGKKNSKPYRGAAPAGLGPLRYLRGFLVNQDVAWNRSRSLKCKFAAPVPRVVAADGEGRN